MDGPSRAPEPRSGVRQPTSGVPERGGGFEPGQVGEAGASFTPAHERPSASATAPDGGDGPAGPAGGVDAAGWAGMPGDGPRDGAPAAGGARRLPPHRVRRLKLALMVCGAAVTIGMGVAIALLMDSGSPPLRLGAASRPDGTAPAAPNSSGASGAAPGLAGAGGDTPADAACPLAGGAPSCPAMVAVPAGRYRIGSRRNDPEAQDEELGGADAEVAAFELSAHEITAGQWQVCVNDGACPASTQPAASAVMPVTGISWDAAAGYAAWLSKKTGRPYRLPTELEWEYAARAGSAKTFPWGDRLGLGHAHCGQCGTLDAFPHFAPVGSYPPQRGLYDMVGNAYEWVADCWTAHHGMPLPPVQAACRDKVQKGGAYDTLEADVRPVARTHGERSAGDPRVGFRVARQPAAVASAPPAPPTTAAPAQVTP